MERAGIERKPRSHGFHLFRHSAANSVHSVTSDLKLAQELLGHATIATTADIYTHLLDEAKARAVTDCCRVSISNEKWDRSEGIFCPFLPHVFVSGCGGGI